MAKDKVIALIRELSEKMGAEVEDVEVSEAAGHTLFTIRTKDSGALIGTRGDTLSALNYVVKRVIEDKEEKEPGIEPFRFMVDVNGYHLKHIRMLENQARILAERARTFKYDVEMSPMSGYDRMIVHAALQDSPNVKTESEGEGKMRHIVIRFQETPATGG